MYKGISRQRSIFKFVFFVFFVSVFLNSKISLANSKDYPTLGSYFTTYYYVPTETQYDNTQDGEFKDVDGKVLAKANSQFKKDTDIEGTGILRDGRTVNFAKRVNGEIRYRFSQARYGWGVGQCKLIPYRTIAVDPANIPLGSTVFIPAIKGLVLPDGTIHDGLFHAEDIGSKINRLHIDLFASEGKDAGKLYEKMGIQTGAYVAVYKVKDPTPGGCQDQPDGSAPSLRETQYLNAHIEALTKLSDEYASLGQKQEMQIALSKIHDLKNQWDAQGQPETVDINSDLVSLHLDQEREVIRNESANVSPEILSELEQTNGYKNEFNGSTLKPGQVVITFDDGPNPHLTPEVHATIKKLGIQAAFFEVGENVEYYPKQTQSLVSDGYIIGNHSYNHPDLVKLTDAEVRDQIDRTQKIITDTLGGNVELNTLFQTLFSSIFSYKRQVTAPEFFRSPYGSRDKRTMDLVEKTDVGESFENGNTTEDYFFHIMWNIDSLDWNDHSPASIEKRVFDQLATEGRHGIILMHDIHPQTIEAIKTILPRLQSEGYELLNLYQMIEEHAQSAKDFLKPRQSLTKN